MAVDRGLGHPGTFGDLPGGDVIRTPVGQQFGEGIEDETLGPVGLILSQWRVVSTCGFVGHETTLDS